VTSGILDCRVFEDVDGAVLEPPSWYEEYTGNVSIKTPYSTTIVYGKKFGLHLFDGAKRMWERHYVDPDLMEFDEVRHPQLDSDLISFKPFGEDRRAYEVRVIGGGSS
jgi:hypothetical protein